MPVKQATNTGLLRLFAILDVDGDKRVSLEELRNELKSFGFTTDQVKSFLHKYDLNKDGKITLEEYKIAFGIQGTQQSDLDEKLDLKRLFNELDTDGSGDITVQQLMALYDRNGLPFLTSEMVDWIRQHDQDKNGKLNQAEFIKFIQKQSSRNA
ncbi:hypothetical protein EG68_01195 [Paragonimus skrjabini miyazakii]|uniref:EF-hand domain-containing protein n=1 Tax=Paragonimus skrjabini miyazakii TaxID=59628 RepID=A0A8S9Z8S5_9TREM|nr:hypothetical protein EG68_01195 [Paragonimus skrjabini miyazakii]